MHLCATKVLLGQDDQIGDELSDLLGLTPMAERIVTDWATAAKGRALWLVGSHVAKVQTVRTSIDVALTNTNDAITAIPALEHGDAVAESGSDESGLAGARVVMADQGSGGAKVAIGVAALPLIAMSSVLMVMAGGGANASPSSSVCGGGGTAQTIGNVKLDAEQMGNAQTIVSVAAGRHLPSFAAVVAVATSYTEVEPAQPAHRDRPRLRGAVPAADLGLHQAGRRRPGEGDQRLPRSAGEGRELADEPRRRRRADRPNLAAPRAIPAQRRTRAADRRTVLARRRGRSRDQHPPTRQRQGPGTPQ